MCHPVGMLTGALMGIAIYISGLCCPPSSCLSSSMNCVIEFHRFGSPDFLPTYPISFIFTVNYSLERGLSKSSTPVLLCSLYFFAISNSIVSFHHTPIDFHFPFVFVLWIYQTGRLSCQVTTLKLTYNSFQFIVCSELFILRFEHLRVFLTISISSDILQIHISSGGL